MDIKIKQDKKRIKTDYANKVKNLEVIYKSKLEKIEEEKLKLEK